MTIQFDTFERKYRCRFTNMNAQTVILWKNWKEQTRMILNAPNAMKKRTELSPFARLSLRAGDGMPTGTLPKKVN